MAGVSEFVPGVCPQYSARTIPPPGAVPGAGLPLP